MGYQVFLMALLVAAVTAVAAQHLRDRAQLWVDRYFFRDRYDAQRMLQELSDLATTILYIDELTAVLLEHLTRTMHVRQVSLMLREQGGVRFRLAAQWGAEPAPETAATVMALVDGE